jgi:putative sigma-54 modulation protein
MEVEYTARQVRISKGLRTLAEEGMERIARVLGKSARASIVFSAQKHLQIVEVTIQARQHTIVTTGKAGAQQSALRQAIDHAEHQVHRHRDRRMTIKRKPKQEKALIAPPTARPKARAGRPVAEAAEEKPIRTVRKARAAAAVHPFPASGAAVEPRIVPSGEAFAAKQMTIEEAVKEAEFRDRDLLVFRNPTGDLFVLHRRRDGQLELVEIP